MFASKAKINVFSNFSSGVTPSPQRSLRSEEKISKILQSPKHITGVSNDDLGLRNEQSDQTVKMS